jgi:hypothetical protein
MKSKASTLLACLVLVMAFTGCDDEKPRFMRITSDYTETSLRGSDEKFPGYWAQEVGSEEEYFLWVLIPSYKKGETIKAFGEFILRGLARYNEETGAYSTGSRLFRVRRAEKASIEKEDPPNPQEKK